MEWTDTRSYRLELLEKRSRVMASSRQLPRLPLRERRLETRAFIPDSIRLPSVFQLQTNYRPLNDLWSTDCPVPSWINHTAIVRQPERHPVPRELVLLHPSRCTFRYVKNRALQLSHNDQEFLRMACGRTARRCRPCLRIAGSQSPHGYLERSRSRQFRIVIPVRY